MRPFCCTFLVIASLLTFVACGGFNEVGSKSNNLLQVSDGSGDLSPLTFAELIPKFEGASLAMAAGTIGSGGIQLTNNYGQPLAVSYGQQLDDSSATDMYDPGASGTFPAGKYLRLIINNANVSDSLGLNLRVRAWDLSTGCVTPPRNECYIDPVNGRFLMPRPMYWNTMESDADMAGPSIHASNASYAISDPSARHSYPGVKYGKGMSLWGGYVVTSQWDIQPGGGGYRPDEGTFSCWIQYIVGPCFPTIEDTFYFGDGGATYVVVNWNTVGIMINGTWAAFGGINPTGGPHHIYITFNRNAPSGDKTVRVFFDGSENCSTTARWGSGFCQVRSLVNGPALSDSYSIMDNLKIWDHVVSEDPSWETGGNEGGLHPMYGAAYQYKPQSVTVGYYSN